MPYNPNFTGQSISNQDMEERAGKGASRLCLGCKAIIKPGTTCPCQEPGAINCPTCKRNITHNQLIAHISVHKGSTDEMLEVRINCPRKGCKGYLYSDLYLADFVKSTILDNGQAEEKTDPQG